ncbi:MAG: hypothetical protein ACOC9H_02645 [Gemmatimonadota bacterium]
MPTIWSSFKCTGFKYTGWYSLLGPLVALLVAGGFLGAESASSAVGASFVAETPVDGVPTPGTCVAGEIPAAGAPLTAAPPRVELDASHGSTGLKGWMELTLARSPFGVTVSPDGKYVYDLLLAVSSQRNSEDRTLVAWAATPNLDEVVKLGVLDGDMRVTGQVDWNRFLVLVTREESESVETWEGSILLTGTSPSGRMHTMRGHGIFEAHGIGC